MNTKDNIKKNLEYIKYFVKWTLLAIITGTLGGVIGSLFHICIDHATYIREQNPFLILLLPVGGVVIALVYNIYKKHGKLDTNRIIDSVTKDENVPFILAPLIFFSATITHLLGGSAGREGAALQLGGSIGYKVGKTARLKPNDMHIAVMSGMAAVFSALFGTPLTAAFFAIEVASVGIMHYGALFPCVISTWVAYFVAGKFGISPVRFVLEGTPAISAAFVVKLTVISVLCALVSILFCKTIHYTEKYGKKYIPNTYIRAIAGGVIIAALTFAIGTYDYNGAGMDIIKKALSGNVRYEAFILKLIFTAITIAAGFKGGEIVPCFFVGSTFGAMAASIFGMNSSFGAALGFVALFCGVTNCPVASLLLALEIFGSEAVIIFAYVCTIAYLFSGNCGLYNSQKIVYSKLDESYININVD
jgi:H+/Cl- antiporter ClcA